MAAAKSLEPSLKDLLEISDAGGVVAQPRSLKLEHRGRVASTLFEMGAHRKTARLTITHTQTYIYIYIYIRFPALFEKAGEGGEAHLYSVKPWTWLVIPPYIIHPCLMHF